MAQERIQPENWGQPVNQMMSLAAKPQDNALKIEAAKKRIEKTKLMFLTKLKEKHSKK